MPDLLQAQLIAISQLDPNAGQLDGLPKNPRFLRDADFARLVASIRDYPEMLSMREVLVYPQKGRYLIIGGNMRYRACKELKLSEVPCKVLPVDTTIDRLKAYVIKDNGSAGNWDMDDLSSEWSDLPLADWGVDLPADWLEQPEVAPEEDDYNGTPPAEPVTVLGDLYELNGHRVLCGDSTDSDAVARLMNGQKADFCFTSPPYNTGGFHPSEAQGSKNYAAYPYLNSDDAKTQDEYLQMNKDIFSNLYLFSTDTANVLYNISYNQKSPYEFILIVADAVKGGWKLHETIVWKKNSAMPLRSRLTRNVEFIFMLSKDHGENPPTNQKFEETIYNCWEISNANTQIKEHGAVFPVELASKAISVFCVGKLILEPFTGSGTTMLASEQLGRTCYGMELDPSYTDLSVKRWVAYMTANNRPYTVKRNGTDITAEAWLRGQ